MAQRQMFRAHPELGPNPIFIPRLLGLTFGKVYNEGRPFFGRKQSRGTETDMPLSCTLGLSSAELHYAATWLQKRGQHSRPFQGSTQL